MTCVLTNCSIRQVPVALQAVLCLVKDLGKGVLCQLTLEQLLP